MRLEIGAQPEAEHGQIFAVNEPAELVDLRRGHELALVNDDDVGTLARGIQRTQILVRGDGLGLGRQTDAAFERERAVALVGGGLDEPDLHAAFLVIIFGDERGGRFGAAHRTVFEIKLCHCFSFSCRRGQ